MRVRGTCHVAVCLLSLLMMFSAAKEKVSAQTDNPAKPNASQKIPLISGHVYRADTRAPIAKATVTLYTAFASSNGSYVTAETDSDGSYSFTDVRLNTYIPKATCDGFVAGDYSLDGTLDGKFLQLKPGVTFQKVDFYLTVAGVISGSISDDHGAPLKNIEVNAVRRQFLAGGAEKVIQVQGDRTDANGIFHLPGLLPGAYFIVANGPHGNTVPGNDYSEKFYPDAASVKNATAVAVVAGDETKDIHISVTAEKRYTLTGQVSGPKPAGDSTRYRYSVGIKGRNSSYSMKDDGTFTMPGVPAGDYILKVLANELPSYQNAGIGEAVVHIADADTHVNLVVDGVAEIHGHAVISDGQQTLAGIRLGIRSEDAANGSAFDANGEFVVTRVLPGQYFFDVIKKDSPIYLKQIRCAGRDYTFEPITIAPEQVISNCEALLADDTGAVNGEVSTGGKPGAELTVVLIPETTALRKLPHYTMVTKVGSDGRFRIANTIPGEYLLFAVPSSDDQPYFAIDFVDKHRAEAMQVKIGPREIKAVFLKQ